MRASIKLAIRVAILLHASQIGARAESVQEWSRRFNVVYITGMATFQANPLRDKGSIIAVPVKFDRMAAENTAIFRGGVLPGRGDASPTAQIVVSNVTGQFTVGDTLVLAFKILGIHSQYGLPHGEFVAAYHCTQPDCQDFLGKIDAPAPPR
jgi:hypothetical protein